jgi:hypothetical protein
MKTKLLLITGVIILSVTSCMDDLFIRGNGIPANEGRLVSEFTSISSEGNFEVHITPGDSYEVLMHAESNLLPYIETDVKGGNLKIHVRGLHGLRNRLPMEVFITMPYLNSIAQSGSGIITTGWFEAETFTCVISGSGGIETSVEADVVDAVISGSGTLVISGVASNAALVISGSGTIDAWDLSVDRCDARISGSGDVWIDVDSYLKAVISGSGNVYYSGTPQLETVVSGSGSVIHKN